MASQIPTFLRSTESLNPTFKQISERMEQQEEGIVVVWPPLPEHNGMARPRPEVPVPRNVRDNADEYARQERMQAEAERQREARDAQLRDKQFRAVQAQQEQLARLVQQQPHQQQQQLQQEISPADTGSCSNSNSLHPPISPYVLPNL